MFPSAPCGRDILLGATSSGRLGRTFHLLLGCFTANVSSICLGGIRFRGLNVSRRLVHVVGTGIFGSSKGSILNALGRGRSVFLVHGTGNRLSAGGMVAIRRVVRASRGRCFSLRRRDSNAGQLFSCVPLVLSFVRKSGIFVVSRVREDLRPSLVGGVLGLCFGCSNGAPYRVVFAARRIVLVARSLLQDSRV